MSIYIYIYIDYIIHNIRSLLGLCYVATLLFFLQSCLSTHWYEIFEDLIKTTQHRLGSRTNPFQRQVHLFNPLEKSIERMLQATVASIPEYVSLEQFFYSPF